GRDVELMAEVAQATGVRIVCATGLYKEDQGAPAYFKFRAQFGDGVKEMTDVFTRELTEGIGETGIRAGVIKVATSAHKITPYEEMVLRAAAHAHRETGMPITTHTDEGTMGVEQLDILTGEGVAPHAIIVGHSDGSSDLHYHLSMLDRGAYLGFDRFGLELLHPDRERHAALIGLLGLDFERQIVLSHDTAWCWRGRPPTLPPAVIPRRPAPAARLDGRAARHSYRRRRGPPAGEHLRLSDRRGRPAAARPLHDGTDGIRRVHLRGRRRHRRRERRGRVARAPHPRGQARLPRASR